MSTYYDAVVIGIGGMGSAAAYHLAQRGQKVLGLEQFDLLHEMGSSHGLTRIIRLAYYEDPSYVPLLHRSFELWRELQAASGKALLHITGSVDISRQDDPVFSGSRDSCEAHGLAHEILSGDELNARFPGYHFPQEIMAVLQPDGGFLVPELCIEAHVELAKAKGAEIHTNEKVIEWEPTANGVRITTDRGSYEAEKLVITAGAWAGKLIPELEKLAVPERQVLLWTQPKRPELYTPERCPVFNASVEEGRYYGFPNFEGKGFKVGCYHHLEEIVDPDTIDRDTYERDEKLLRDFAERYFPEAAGESLFMKVCMFTNSPDEHFIIDTLPSYPQVTFASGFSGHGFKMCSVVGEVLADFSLDGQTSHDMHLLRLPRLIAGEA